MKLLGKKGAHGLVEGMVLLSILFCEALPSRIMLTFQILKTCLSKDECSVQQNLDHGKLYRPKGPGSSTNNCNKKI